MARLAILINSANTSIADFNGDVMGRGGPHEAVNAIINLLKGAVAGAEKDMVIEVTSRDDDVVIATSGTGSQQETHNI